MSLMAFITKWNAIAHFSCGGIVDLQGWFDRTVGTVRCSTSKFFVLSFQFEIDFHKSHKDCHTIDFLCFVSSMPKIMYFKS